MSFIEWTPERSIGVADLDDEHKQLATQLNALYDAIHMNLAPKMMLATMDALVFYVSTHFTHEEEYMVATNYPDSVGHRIEHDILRSKIMEMHARMLENASDALANELLAFMKGWVSGHIMYCDKELGAHIIQHQHKKAS